MKSNPKFLQACSRWEGILGAWYLFKQWEKAGNTGIHDHFWKELVCFPGTSLKKSKTTFNFFASNLYFCCSLSPRKWKFLCKTGDPHPALLLKHKHQNSALSNLQCSTPERMGLGWNLNPLWSWALLPVYPSGVPSYPPSAPEVPVLMPEFLLCHRNVRILSGPSPKPSNGLSQPQLWAQGRCSQREGVNAGCWLPLLLCPCLSRSSVAGWGYTRDLSNWNLAGEGGLGWHHHHLKLFWGLLKDFALNCLQNILAPNPGRSLALMTTSSPHHAFRDWSMLGSLGWAAL